LPDNNASHPTGEWPSPAQYRKSIRLEFAVYVGGIILLLMLITGAIVTNRLVDTVTQSVVDKLLVQARSYASAAGKHIIAAEGPDALMLTDICQKLAADNKDLGWVGIVGTNNIFLAHTDVKQVITGQSLPRPAATTVESSTRHDEVLVLGKDSIFVAVPITDQSLLLGYLALSSTTREISSVRQASIITVALITLIMIILGVPVTLIVLSQRLKPLRIITSSLRNVDVRNISFDLSVKSANEFGYLAETLRIMGARLEIAQKQMLENERMSRELEIAREIQANILPKSYPFSPQCDFSGMYRSAKEVGGDYFDFFELGENEMGFLVADVSGKSLPGMLIMMLTRDIVIRAARNETEPDRLLAIVNRELLQNIRKGMFVTMFIGVLDKRSGQFKFASAGHNPLIWQHGASGEVDLLKTKGYPLGMMPSDSFDKRIEKGRIDLADGDCLIQYTDGINEAQDSAGEEYGMTRFVDFIRGAQKLTPRELAEALAEKHAAFVGEAPQYDDITLLVMKWHGNRTCDQGQHQEKAIHAA
jgi:serine phosphatase RsbU (regulator of sigma subunit)